MPKPGASLENSGVSQNAIASLDWQDRLPAKLLEKSGLTASSGRGSLPATHAIPTSRDQRKRWIPGFLTRAPLNGGSVRPAATVREWVHRVHSFAHGQARAR
jgi:hypothetical protein